MVRPDQWSDWRTSASKEWKAEQLEAGKTIITDAELVLITGMARSLGAHPLVKAGILDGVVERSLIFKDKKTGVWLKSRPDAIPHRQRVIHARGCHAQFRRLMAIRRARRHDRLQGLAASLS